LIQVIVKQIVVIFASLALVAAEEVKAVHVGDTPGSRSRLNMIIFGNDKLPLVLADAVGVQVVQSLFVVSATEEVNFAIREDALMACARRENLSQRQNFHPVVLL
jgi:hypothetical protein